MANIVLPQNHHPNCVPNLQRPSGFAGANRHNEFIQRYIIDPGFNFPAFNVECLGCCYAYLTVDRAYGTRPDQSDRVYFINYNLGAPPPGVVCKVRAPGGGGVNGEIFVDIDMNLGNPQWRPFNQSRTFQMYSAQPLNSLSIGALVTTRFESVAIDVVQVAGLSAGYMDYADATLAEIYRAIRNLPSLHGFCSRKSDEASCRPKKEQPPEVPKVASKLEDMTIKTERSDVEASGGTKEEQPPLAPKVDVDTAASKLEDMTMKTE